MVARSSPCTAFRLETDRDPPNVYLRDSGALPHEAYHWATPQGAELDLLLVRGDMRFTMRPGIEALPVAELDALRGALG